MAPSGIALIAGLGNPGANYADSRHNVGVRFIERLQLSLGFRLVPKKSFRAAVACVDFAGRLVRIMVPNTFMNLSGQAIAPLASFYRIPPQQILVIHDELDINVGETRLKLGGGHGGHNGLRDIISNLGSNDFARLRIGIGHPGANRDVVAYVLSKPEADAQISIENAMQHATDALADIIAGDFAVAMQKLHSSSQPL